MQKGDQRRSKRDQDRTRQTRTNALFTFSLTPPQTPEKSKILSKNNEKKRDTFSKPHHDSPIDLTPPQTPEKSKILSKNNEKKRDTFSKPHHDSPIEGIKTSNLQFWGICNHAISVEMSVFDRARFRALSVYVGSTFDVLIPSLGESWWAILNVSRFFRYFLIAFWTFLGFAGASEKK